MNNDCQLSRCTCPQCGRRLKTQLQNFGKKGRCPNCDHRFLISHREEGLGLDLLEPTAVFRVGSRHVDASQRGFDHGRHSLNDFLDEEDWDDEEFSDEIDQNHALPAEDLSWEDKSRKGHKTKMIRDGLGGCLGGLLLIISGYFMFIFFDWLGTEYMPRAVIIFPLAGVGTLLFSLVWTIIGFVRLALNGAKR